MISITLNSLLEFALLAFWFWFVLKEIRLLKQRIKTLEEKSVSLSDVDRMIKEYKEVEVTSDVKFPLSKQKGKSNDKRR